MNRKGTIIVCLCSAFLVMDAKNAAAFDTDAQKEPKQDVAYRDVEEHEKARAYDAGESVYNKAVYANVKVVGQSVSSKLCFFIENEGKKRFIRYHENLNLRNGYDAYGSGHPQYKNAIYAWEYTKNSFSHEALYGNFAFTCSDKNRLVRIDEHGTKTQLYEGNGYGSIWIVSDRLYVYRNIAKDGYDIELFSLNMQGEDERVYGGYHVCAVYERYLILEDQKKTNLYVMDTETENIQEVCRNAQFLYQDGHTIYYTDTTKEEQKSHVVLRSITLDGSKNIRLADIQKDDLADTLSMMREPIFINCVQVLDEKVYFSYGIYAGTAFVYQGGGVAMVNKDGSDLQILDGSFADFTVYDDGELQEYGKLGQPFQDGNGSIWIYDHNEKIKLLTNGKEYHRSNGAKQYDIVRNVDVQGAYVYYMIHHVEQDEDLSIEGREGYRWKASEVYRKNIKTGVIEQLYAL